MSVGWFLEKNAKFYGPFLAEKVLSYAAAGKIGKNTLVARDVSGKDAKPYYQIEALLRQGENPVEGEVAQVASVAPQPFEGMVASPMAPTTDASLGPQGIAKEWYVVTEERRFGPFSLGHLESLVSQGKLKPKDRLQREGQSHLVDVIELFPDGPANKPAKPVATKTPPKAAAKPPPAPVVAAKGFRPGRVNVFMALVLAVILAVALAVLWPSADKDKGQLPGSQALRQLQTGIEKSSSLRRLATEAESPPPNYGALVEDALRDGLNFDYQSLAVSRASDLKIYSQDGPKEFGFLFGDQIRREVRYAKNGGYYYTYLSAADGNIFAVVITSDGFKRVLRKSSKLGDFAAEAREASEYRGTTWTTSPTLGVLAKAYWEQDEQGRECLRCVLVMNDPKVG